MKKQSKKATKPKKQSAKKADPKLTASTLKALSNALRAYTRYEVATWYDKEKKASEFLEAFKGHMAKISKVELERLQTAKVFA